LHFSEDLVPFHEVSPSFGESDSQPPWLLEIILILVLLAVLLWLQIEEFDLENELISVFLFIGWKGEFDVLFVHVVFEG
jgi:hypothetical protein